MKTIYASSTSRIKIPFYDIDMMNVAWHGHYPKYLEVVREELMESVGYGVDAMRESGYAWPVIDMHIRYPQPLIFRQLVDVEALIVEIEHRLKIEYTIRDNQTRKRLTRAHTIQVAVRVDTGEMLFASPPVLTDKFTD